MVDVVFDDGDEHDSPHEVVEKRILVNISIAMDSGLGSLHQNVYQLQVAVPLPKPKDQKFYAYNVEPDIDFMTMEQLVEFNESTAHPDEALSTDEPLTSTLDYSDDSSTSVAFDDGFISSSPPPYHEGLGN